MDDGLDLALVFGAERNHVTPVSLRDDVLLQHGSGARVGDVFLQAGHQAVVGHAYLAAQGREFGRGRVEHFAAFGEGARDRVHEAIGFGEAARDLGQVRKRTRPGTGLFAFRFDVLRRIRLALVGFVEHFLQVARRNQRGLNVEHVSRVDHAAAPRQFHRGTHVMRAADADIRGGKKQARFGRFGLEALDLFEMDGRL